MVKMKQNKNTSVVLRVSSFCIALIVLFCSFAIPSFAEEEISWNSCISPVFLSSDSQSVRYNGALPFRSTSGSYRGGTLYSGSTVYQCLVFNQNQNSLYYTFLSVSSTSPSCFIIRPSGNSYESYNANTTGGSGEYSYSAVYMYQSSTPTNTTVPIFNSYEEAISSLDSFLNGGSSGGSTVAEFNYSIKPGYALFIDIHGLSDVSGTLFTNTSVAYASPHTSNQTLSYQSALPSGNVSPQGNGINWQGTGNKDLFGRYKSWNRSLIIQPNAHYIAVYNPVHINTYVDPEHEDFNGSINVHVNKAYSETSILIPLNTELTSTGTVGTNTSEEQKPVVYDENTNTWVPENSDGTPYTESPYGDYMPSTVNSIHDWLQNIANLISGFFNGAIGAVTTLVGAGSAFINQLVSLYSWLPAPVYAVLSSALILVITIGVIKVFI